MVEGVENFEPVVSSNLVVSVVQAGEVAASVETADVADFVYFAIVEAAEARAAAVEMVVVAAEVFVQTREVHVAADIGHVEDDVEGRKPVAGDFEIVAPVVVAIVEHSIVGDIVGSFL